MIAFYFIVVLETGQSQFYVSKTKFACMHRLNLAAKKNTERRAGLRSNWIHEKLNYPKRFTDNIE